MLVSELSPKIKEKYAIVIGISDYKHGVSIGSPDCGQPAVLCDLRYTAKDTQAFYDLLIDPQVGNIPKENVYLLKDEWATASNIADVFGKVIALAEEDDLVIIYYSGHGARAMIITGMKGKEIVGTNIT